MGKKTHALTYWLWFVVLASLLHILRDVQFLGVDTLIANIAVKEVAAGQSIIWHPLNTVIIECVMLFLALRALQKKNFDWEAKLALVIAIATALGFAYYWFFA